MYLYIGNFMWSWPSLFPLSVSMSLSLPPLFCYSASKYSELTGNWGFLNTGTDYVRDFLAWQRRLLFCSQLSSKDYTTTGRAENRDLRKTTIRRGLQPLENGSGKIKLGWFRVDSIGKQRSRKPVYVYRIRFLECLIRTCSVLLCYHRLALQVFVTPHVTGNVEIVSREAVLRLLFIIYGWYDAVWKSIVQLNVIMFAQSLTPSNKWHISKRHSECLVWQRWLLAILVRFPFNPAA